MEQQLLSLLIENAPASVKAELNAGHSTAVINAKGRSDVVTARIR